MRTGPARSRWALLVLVLAARGGAEAQDASAAQRYQALVAEYRRGGPSFRAAKSAEERRAAIEHMDGFCPRFLEVAEDAADPNALEALVEVVRTVNAEDSLTQVSWEMGDVELPRTSQQRWAERAVALALRDHLTSARLVPLCQRMSYGLRPEFEAFLRAALEKNPQREVQAQACLALAELLNSRLEKLALLAERPGFAERFEALLGAGALAELRRRERGPAVAEVEALLERAASYGDLPLYDDGSGSTIGARARAELFALRDLAVGRTAPDIEGEDQHGARFRLSDYRGRVVLLDFWQEY